MTSKFLTFYPFFNSKTVISNTISDVRLEKTRLISNKKCIELVAATAFQTSISYQQDYKNTAYETWY